MLMLLFLKASKYIFLYFFPFNNERRSDLRNSLSALGIFRALLMVVEHATSTPSSLSFNNRLAHPFSATPSTLPQIQGHAWVVVFWTAASRRSHRNHWDSKGKGLGIFTRRELLLMTLFSRSTMVSFPTWVPRCTSFDYPCQQHHHDISDVAPQQSTWPCNVRAVIFQHRLSGWWRTYDYDPPSPPFTNDGDHPPLPPQRPCVPTTHGWQWAPTQAAGGPLSSQHNGTLNVRRAGGWQCEIPPPPQRATSTHQQHQVSWAYPLPPFPIMTHTTQVPHCP